MKDKKINFNNFVLYTRDNSLDGNSPLASYKNLEDAKKACYSIPNSFVKSSYYKIYDNETLILDNVIYN